MTALQFSSKRASESAVPARDETMTHHWQHDAVAGNGASEWWIKCGLKHSRERLSIVRIIKVYTPNVKQGL